MLNTRKTLIMATICISIFDSFANCATQDAKNYTIETKSELKRVKIGGALSQGSGIITLKKSDRAAADRRISFHLADQTNVIPEKLGELHKTLASFSKETGESEFPDIIDIVLLLDASGKFQAITLMKFLAKIESMLMTRTNEIHPGSNLRLSACIDTAVGAGAGSIPAVIVALGDKTVGEAIPIVFSMPTQNIMPKSLYGCCGFVRDAIKVVGAGISAYTDKPKMVNDDSPDWDSLVYDSFKLSGRGYDQMVELFGSNSLGDLRTCCEVVSLKHNSGNLIELVAGALKARDKDAKASIGRMALAESVNTATGILAVKDAIGIDSEVLGRAQQAVEAINKVSIVLSGREGETKGALTELRARLLDRTDISRNLLIVALTADTYGGEFFVSNFNSKVTQARNGKRIVNMDYRFMLPSQLYHMKEPAKTERFASVIETGIDNIFHRKGRESTIAMSVRFLADFLADCNKRALEGLATDESL